MNSLELLEVVMLAAAVVAVGVIIWRVLGPPPRIGYREVWLSCPWVDRDTGNWSNTRTICLIATFSWVHVVETMAHPRDGVPVVNPFNWPSVSVLALILVGSFSKNIADFSRGAGVVFQRLRRKSDAQPAVREGDVQVRQGE